MSGESHTQHHSESAQVEKLAQAAAMIFKKPAEVLVIAREMSQVFTREAHFTEHVLALSTEGTALYLLGNYEAGVEKLNAVLALPETPETMAYRINALGYLGETSRMQGDYIRAFEITRDCLALSEQHPYERGIIDANNRLGILLDKLGDYAGSLDYYFAALAASKNEASRAIPVLTNLGILYRKIGNLPEALRYQEQALVSAEQFIGKQAVAYVLNNIATIYTDQQQFEKAIEFHQRSLVFKRQIQDRWGESTSLANIGSNLIELGRVDEAEHYLHEAMLMSDELGDSEGKAYILKDRSKIAVRQADYTAAIAFLNQAIAFMDGTASRDVLYPLHELLSDAYKARNHEGDLLLALHHYQTFHRIEKELYNETSSRRTQFLEAKHRLEQTRKEKEIAELRNVELANALQLANEANAFKSELLSLAAHDLKNPLQIILGYASLITEASDAPPATSVAFAEQIKKAVTRMLTLITDLLESVKTETRHLLLELGEVDIAALLEKLIARQNVVAAAKQIQIVQRRAVAVPIHADATHLESIFENLIGNAIKYSPRGGTVTISVERKLQDTDSVFPSGCLAALTIPSLLIAIKDDGQGLSDVDKAKLFVRFQRLSAKPTGGESSTGLGLSIVKHLVELHNGKIWAESDGKNKGTTFFVELPLEQTPQTEQHHE
jgi:signal transduction histidine kinase